MANRSTKKSLERFKYEVADELGVPFKRCGKLVVGFNEEDKQKLIAMKEQGEKNGVKGLEIIGNDRSTGKTDGWQRRKHPVTHLSQCTKEKSRSLSRRPAYSFAGIYKFIFESCSS